MAPATAPPNAACALLALAACTLLCAAVQGEVVAARRREGRGPGSGGGASRGPGDGNSKRRRLGASTRGGSPAALTWRGVPAPPGVVVWARHRSAGEAVAVKWRRATRGGGEDALRAAFRQAPRELTEAPPRAERRPAHLALVLD